jgi:hypothetical protein
MTPPELVAILEMVPEKKLLLFPLVWEVIGEDGQINPEKSLFYVQELQLAIKDAQITASENRKLLEAIVLWTLRAEG